MFIDPPAGATETKRLHRFWIAMWIVIIAIIIFFVIFLSGCYEYYPDLYSSHRSHRDTVTERPYNQNSEEEYSDQSRESSRDSDSGFGFSFGPKFGSYIDARGGGLKFGLHMPMGGMGFGFDF